MKTKYLVAIVVGIVLFACTVPNDARILKRSTKDWRKSPVKLSAYQDTPFAGIFLALRANGKFEHTSSGILQSFQAGTWLNHEDTIILTYLNSRLVVDRAQTVYIDRKTSTLKFDGDDRPLMFRLRILLNELL